MRARVLHTFFALVFALGLAGSGVAPASAITGGTPDTENVYSNVGMIVFYDDGSRFRCTATLISPTLLLTAGHCTFGTEGSTLVDFRPVIDDEPPLDIPRAADPEAGYTAREIQRAGFVSGTGYTHPEYSNFTDLANWNDVGVIVLDRPVDIAPATIAELGTLDAIAPDDLSKTIFRAVGYGTEVRKAETGPQNPQPMTFPLIRRYADMPGQKLTPQILQTNGNENDTRGTGGTCFGDSGGPLLLDGEVVGVTSYGYTSNCRYIDGYQRVDIAVVQDWLATFATTDTGKGGRRG
ncbi:MAG: S1 family peptidase [Nocardioidaceae bacterium]